MNPSAQSGEQPRPVSEAAPALRLRWPYLGILGADLLVVAVVALSIWQGWANYRASASLQVENLSKVLENDIANLAGKIDLSLLGVVDEYTRQERAGGVNQTAFQDFLAHQALRLPWVLALRVVNAKGEHVYDSSGRADPSVNLANRPRFIKMRDNPQAGLLISSADKGRISGKWVVIMARRLSHPDGSFAGEVHASVETGMFIKLFSSLNMGAGSFFALRAPDMTVIARYPEAGATGISNITPLYQNIVASGVESALFEATSPIDGLSRLCSYRRIPGLGLHLSMGLAPQDFLAQWRRESVLMACGAVLFILATSLMAWRTRRAVTEHLRAEGQIKDNEIRLQGLANLLQHKAGTVREFLDQALDEALRLTRSKMGYIYYYDGQTRRFTLYAWSRAVAGLCRVSEAPVQYELDDTGLWGEAVRQAKPIIVNDYQGENPLKKGLPEGHVRLFRFLTVPVFNGESIVAVAGVANKDQEYGGADASHLSLLMEAAWKETERIRAEEALREAKIKAESAAMAKSQFLASMSHEIRTPLGGVLAMLQVLENGELDPEQRECVTMASQAGRNLLVILNDILDLSKIEAGRMEIFEEPFCLKDLAESVWAMFTPQAREKGLNLSCQVHPELPVTVLGDAPRLRQILFNLLGNAVKFTPAGSVALEVYPHHGPHPGRGRESARLCFRVSDTGIGIPAAKLNAVFEPFIQADGALSRGYQGTGLGLAMVKRLVELMGGTVDLCSTEGQGTTATFAVPLKPAQAAAPPAEATRPDTPGPARILLVEDDRINQLATRRLLEKRGQTVLCAANGREALDILTAQDVDVVLMDIQMPVMDGLEALGRIRAGEAGEGKKGLPVVALTAHTMKGDEEALLKAGFTSHLAKPLDIAQLMATLVDLIKP